MSEISKSHCTLCGKESLQQARFKGTLNPQEVRPQSFSPRVLENKLHFDFVECMKCGILFSNPILPETLLEKLYTESSMEEAPLLAEQYSALEKHIYGSYQPILNLALKKLKSRRCFLEVGGGSGFMLRYGVENDFQQQIELELSGQAFQNFNSPSPNSKFLQKSIEKSGIPASSISLICFFQILDHVADPRQFLTHAFDLLEPGGVAVCVVHNTSALPNRLLGARSPILNICHNYLFNPKNLTALFQKVGFSEVSAFPISNRYPIWYWLYLIPFPRALKNFFQKIVTVLRLAKLPVSLSAGNFAVIATKQSGQSHHLRDESDVTLLP